MTGASQIGWRSRFAAAALFLWAGLIPPSPAVAALCGGSKSAPQLRVTVDGGEVVWDHTLGDAEIKQITDQNRGYVRGSWYRPIGLTTATLTSRYATRVSVRRKTGGYCAYLAEGRVEVG